MGGDDKRDGRMLITTSKDSGARRLRMLITRSKTHGARDGTPLNHLLQQTVLLAALTTLGQRRGGNGLDDCRVKGNEQ